MFYLIRQNFEKTHVKDVYSETKKSLYDKKIPVKPKERIAIAVGSRGIAGIREAAKGAVDYVKENKATPIIVPAMGSHGKGLAEGQKKILESYGITEDYTGAPIVATMEVVELKTRYKENRVYMDKEAYQSDGVIVINRIKRHTDFDDEIESGLMKMCVIGLGNHTLAREIHSFGIQGLIYHIKKTARVIIDSGKIIAGLGIVENAYEQVKIVEAIKPENIEKREKELLKIAKASMPSLPVDKIDVLLIDEIGKYISGSGMDTNIIGRIGISGVKDPEKPDIKMIVVCDLTENSHGNFVGLGLADFTTRKLFNKLDMESTYINILTSGFVDRSKIPLVAENEKTAFNYALNSCNLRDDNEARIMRIKNTLKIHELIVSENIYSEITNRSELEKVCEYKDIFTDSGELIPF